MDIHDSVVELRNLRHTLGRQIAQLVQEFESATNLEVREIDLIRLRGMYSESVCTGANIEVAL